MEKTFKFEIIDDTLLEEIAVVAATASDAENFLGYANSITSFHHYVASMAIELQQRRGLEIGDFVTKIIVI